MRFVRYVVSQRDRSSGYRRGFIRAAGYLDQEGVFSHSESVRLQQIFDWFNKYLPRPTKLSRTRNAAHKKKRALSWFKDSAHEHLAYAREMVTMMEAHDVVVEMISTERPGYVVYEDEFQVVAEPFNDTQT